MSKKLKTYSEFKKLKTNTKDLMPKKNDEEIKEFDSESMEELTSVGIPSEFPWKEKDN